eukprot:scaffold203_cov145-Skeletonema_marinoi.AAC.9
MLLDNPRVKEGESVGLLDNPEVSRAMRSGWLNEAAEDLNVDHGKGRESLDKVVGKGIVSLKNRTVRKGRDSLKYRAVGKGKVNLDDSLNLEQGRVLMSTRHSLYQEVTKGDDTELPVVCRMMKHDNANWGDMASQQVGTDIGRGVSTDDTMVEVCLSSNNVVLEYEHSMVKYGNAKIRQVKTEVTTSLEKTDEASLTEKVKLSLVLAKTETKSENGKYYDKKSSTWINVWLLLSIASWKVYLQEQEKYRWRVREFDSRIQEAKPKGSVIHSGQWHAEAHHQHREHYKPKYHQQRLPALDEHDQPRRLMCSILSFFYNTLQPCTIVPIPIAARTSRTGISFFAYVDTLMYPHSRTSMTHVHCCNAIAVSSQEHQIESPVSIATMKYPMNLIL